MQAILSLRAYLAATIDLEARATRTNSHSLTSSADSIQRSAAAPLFNVPVVEVATNTPRDDATETHRNCIADLPCNGLHRDTR